jgi:hypothetical protein
MIKKSNHSPILTLKSTVQNSSHLKGIQKTELYCFGLEDQGKVTDLWIWRTELARVCPDFNYVLSFGMTSVAEGRKYCITNCKVS